MSIEDDIARANVTQAHNAACVAAIRKHLGGKPELVKDLVEALRPFAEATDTTNSTIIWPDMYTVHIKLGPDYGRARALLSRIENGDG